MNRKQGIGFLAMGIILFILRYIPVYHVGDGEIINKWFSLSSGVSFCNSFIGSLASTCDWVKPLNMVVTVLIVGLIAYGGYVLFQKKNDT